MAAQTEGSEAKLREQLKALIQEAHLKGYSEPLASHMKVNYPQQKRKTCTVLTISLWLMVVIMGLFLSYMVVAAIVCEWPAWPSLTGKAPFVKPVDFKKVPIESPRGKLYCEEVLVLVHSLVATHSAIVLAFA
jgi:hypothetical protein